mmetsp:Transcript_5167/g.7573  ORF Transcript_5167/g.7573 Transcript_5167/m.7573 type:complete len:190 (+) Transcript_5167:156-725(+)
MKTRPLLFLTMVTIASASSLRGKDFLQEERQIEETLGDSKNIERELNINVEILGAYGGFSCFASTLIDRSVFTPLLDANFNTWVSQCEDELNLPDYGNTYSLSSSRRRRRLDENNWWAGTYQCLTCPTGDCPNGNNCRKLKQKENARNLISPEHEAFENCMQSKVQAACVGEGCTSDLSSLQCEINIYA